MTDSQSLLVVDSKLLGDIPLDILSLIVSRQEWLVTARADQLPPKEYFVWLLLGGRGSGKTRAGAEDMAWNGASRIERIAIIGPTLSDVRKTCFEGESGLLSVIPSGMIVNYNRSSLEMWLTNGSYFVGYSSEEPERLRGPQHHRVWCEELCAWRKRDATWDMMMFGLRLGSDPQIIITSTPKPSKLLREIVAENDTSMSRTSTFDNRANLPKKMLEKLTKKYDGTRLGRQELYAEIIDEAEGALWTLSMLESARFIPKVKDGKVQLPEMKRVVVAVDPAITSNQDSSETGIIAAGIDFNDHGVVIKDRSGRYSPGVWAKKVVELYHEVGADRIVVEVNQGGDMVRHTINTEWPSAPITMVHASRGKAARAEPIAALYEQNRVRHVWNPSEDDGTHTDDRQGGLMELEDQLVSWEPLSGHPSPDRLDALVWALTDLMIDPTVVTSRELVL